MIAEGGRVGLRNQGKEYRFFSESSGSYRAET